MSPVRVTIQPRVLAWALESTGLSEDELLRKFSRLPEWRSGESSPTLRQAMELADAAHIPFGRLLLETPTGEEVGVADFRTLNNAGIAATSPGLRETIFANQNRLAWYASYADEEGIDPPEPYSSKTPEEGPAQAAARARLALGLAEFKPVPGRDKVAELSGRMEEAGILVARNSIVGNSTRRKLDVNEFRGFTLADDGYALVFVNTRDAKSAQLFSLAHELGHVVLGQPGISDHSDRLNLERWCNSFAAAFLGPAEAVESEFDGGELLDSLSTLSRRFGLSREAMLFRLVELGLIERSEAAHVVGAVKNDSHERSEEGGAPPPYILIRSRVGGRFFDTVTRAAANGQIPEMEAARYLGAASHESFAPLRAEHASA